MPETSADLPTDWWTTSDVLAFLKRAGTPISRATWAAYVSRDQAPKPARMIGRTPVWTPKSVRDWQAARPRRGSVVES
jgi:predicted DNA-binding transcriptional regulator AlpA